MSCDTTPFTNKNTPYSRKLLPIARKNSPFSKKISPFSNGESPYDVKMYCDYLLQESTYPILLESGGKINI